MSLPCFYESGITRGATVFTLSEETSRHCAKVLRMKTGEQMNLTDGKGNLFTATVLSPDKKNTAVSIGASAILSRPSKQVTIGISLLKNNSRFEWFLEKATEIGIHRIIPMICQRTERQHFRHDRMQGILVAAMLQSQQAWLPVLSEPLPCSEVVSMASPQKFIAHCEAHQKQELKDAAPGREVLMLIGPEGDFSPEEISAALAHGFEPVSLGQTRLRTETAGIVAAAVLMNL